ncbi:MAG: ribonuclease T [Xanthomonadales bacterium]|nr:ribonuclease T [Xanthomonadales bacterium]
MRIPVFSLPLMLESNMPRIVDRFRGFLPVVVDIESGGFNAKTDALLEIAACILCMDDFGRLKIAETLSAHVEPFPGSRIEPSSLEFTGIDLDDPDREAISEREAIQKICLPVRQELRATECQRAILVGHNPAFDLSFLAAAVARVNYKRNPFHPFSSFDTATLGGLAFGQTVLARAVQAAGIDWDESEAHSAEYDTIKTAELFCNIVNRWKLLTESPDEDAEDFYGSPD